LSPPPASPGLGGGRVFIYSLTSTPLGLLKRIYESENLAQFEQRQTPVFVMFDRKCLGAHLISDRFFGDTQHRGGLGHSDQPLLTSFALAVCGLWFTHTRSKKKEGNNVAHFVLLLIFNGRLSGGGNLYLNTTGSS
jgi:hypothetical protein